MHFFGGIVGKPEALDKFENYMLTKRYATSFPNAVGHFMQPNMRQVIFLRITVPEVAEDLFLDDLKPYVSTGGEIKKRLFFLSKLLGKVIGLQPVKKSEGLSVLGDGWRSAVTVLVLGKEVEK